MAATEKDDKTKSPDANAAVQGKGPQVDGFKIKARMKAGSMGELAKSLATLSFLEVAQEKEAVNAVYVESRDIQKNPYLFSILKIKKDEIEILYSIPSGIAPRKRRLDIIRYLLNILSIIEPYYSIDNKAIYLLVENVVKEISESVTLDYARIYTAYDSLKKESSDLRKRVSRLGDENQALTNKNYEIKGKYDELIIKFSQLQSLSDDALKTRLQEWVADHNGEINIYEFCKVHSVQESKVEDMLNQLVSEGYLEILG